MKRNGTYDATLSVRSHILSHTVPFPFPLPFPLPFRSYEWTVTAGAGTLDPRVTLGLFTYALDPEQTHREIDIEFGRFGRSPARDPTNAQWALKPVNATGHLQVNFSI